MGEPTKVIFDSSFLMALVARPTTWFEDMVEKAGRIQPILLDCVGDELRKMAAGQGRKARDARVSLDLAYGFGRLPCGRGRVDDEIVSSAIEGGALVATVDAGLIRALRSAHVGVVSLRGGRVALL